MCIVAAYNRAFQSNKNENSLSHVYSVGSSSGQGLFAGTNSQDLRLSNEVLNPSLPYLFIYTSDTFLRQKILRKIFSSEDKVYLRQNVCPDP
jgi:hypothetical protein